MKIDGFDIISKASLSHMPAVEGTEGDQLAPSIHATAVMEGFFFHPCVYLLLYFYMVINISYYNLIHKHIPTFCKSSDPKHLMFIYVYHYKKKVITLMLKEMSHLRNEDGYR